MLLAQHGYVLQHLPSSMNLHFSNLHFAHRGLPLNLTTKVQCLGCNSGTGAEPQGQVRTKSTNEHSNNWRSNTVLSHSLVCFLELEDKLPPSHVTSQTATGKTEKPTGVLPAQRTFFCLAPQQ